MYFAHAARALPYSENRIFNQFIVVRQQNNRSEGACNKRLGIPESAFCSTRRMNFAYAINIEECRRCERRPVGFLARHQQAVKFFIYLFIHSFIYLYSYMLVLRHLETFYVRLWCSDRVVKRFNNNVIKRFAKISGLVVTQQAALFATLFVAQTRRPQACPNASSLAQTGCKTTGAASIALLHTPREPVQHPLSNFKTKIR